MPGEDVSIGTGNRGQVGVGSGHTTHWFTGDTVGGIFVGDFLTRHVLGFGVQPDVTLIFGADTGEWSGIGGFESDTCVVGTTETATGTGNTLESSGIIDVLDGITEMTGVIGGVCYEYVRFIGYQKMENWDTYLQQQSIQHKDQQ